MGYRDEESILEDIEGSIDFSDFLYPRQQAVVNDPALLRVVFGGRRSSKSVLIAAESLMVADQFAGMSIPYCSSSITNGLDILMPYIRQLDTEHNLKLHYNLGDHKVFTPGGGCVQFYGWGSKSEIEKGRGLKIPALYVDECFVAGTVINAIGAIQATSCRPAPSLLVTVNGVTSTSDHPYLTPEGWIRAEDITTETMLCVWEGFRPELSQGTQQDLLLALPFGGDICDSQGERYAHAAASGACKSLGAARERDSTAAETVRGEVLGHDEAYWAQAEAERRERPWRYVAGIPARECHWLACGSSGYHRERIPSAPLQAGPCLPINEAGDRGRREQSPHPTGESEGRAQSGVAIWKRVDAVEVHERGGAGRYSEVCPDGLVYNLTTESGVYLAGGMLVHNCGKIPQSLLKRGITETFGPATADFQGVGGRGILMSGNPDYVPGSYWNDMCGGNTGVSKMGASVHHMTIFNNLFFEGRADSVVDEFCRQNRMKRSDSVVQREWFGRFCVDSDGLAYPHWKGIVHPMHLMPLGGYTSLGLDLGSDHPCAWVVIRWVLTESVDLATNTARYIHHGHVLETYEESGLMPNDVAAITKEFQKAYSVGVTHGDSGGGGKMTIEHLRDVMGIDIQPVTKAAHKEDRIWMLDGMLGNGTLHVHDRCQTLIEQFSSVPKERKSNGRYDHMSGYHDHSLDATHYAILAAKQHLTELDLGPKIGSRDWAKDQTKRDSAAASKALMRSVSRRSEMMQRLRERRSGR